ncbi:hypothetical protein KC845_02495 [Candidatus Kaiserbacteria bacterium]|nr:hypothetical protein [Candidatus Kaiserbacteria bacterium]
MSGLIISLNEIRDHKEEQAEKESDTSSWSGKVLIPEKVFHESGSIPDIVKLHTNPYGKDVVPVETVISVDGFMVREFERYKDLRLISSRVVAPRVVQLIALDTAQGTFFNRMRQGPGEISWTEMLGGDLTDYLEKLSLDPSFFPLPTPEGARITLELYQRNYHTEPPPIVWGELIKVALGLQAPRNTNLKDWVEEFMSK